MKKPVPFSVEALKRGEWRFEEWLRLYRNTEALIVVVRAK